MHFSIDCYVQLRLYQPSIKSQHTGHSCMSWWQKRGQCRQQSHSVLSAPLVVAVIGYVRTQSGMHSPTRLQTSLRNSIGKSPHISYANSLPPTVFGKLHEPFYTIILTLVHSMSRCYAPAAYPKCCRQTQLLSLVQQVRRLWLSFLAILHNCRHSIQAHLRLSQLPEHQVVRKYSACGHSACGYCVKLQRQEYMVRQKIIISLSQFNSLVWGSLTLAPITLCHTTNTCML